MDGKAHATDNRWIENFWRRLKHKKEVPAERFKVFCNQINQNQPLFLTKTESELL